MKNSRKDKQKDTEKEIQGSKGKNIRVYELAKQYDISSRELVEELHAYGVPVKNHMSTLDPEMVELVESERSGKKTEPTPPKQRVPAASETAAAPEPKELVREPKEEGEEEGEEDG